MSILNRSHKFIFVHVPKSAGTSLTRALSGLTRIGDVEIGGSEFGEILARAYEKRFGIRKHSTAREIRSVVDESMWDESFKFAFVRNPFSRTYSIFQFLKTRFRDWSGSEIMDSFQTFDEFVSSDFFASDGPDRLLRPQIFWIRTSSEAESLAVDFVGRVESIEVDLATVLRRISPGMPFLADLTDRANASTDPDAWLSAYSNRQTIERVRSRYANDFRIFAYSTDIPE